MNGSVDWQISDEINIEVGKIDLIDRHCRFDMSK